MKTPRLLPILLLGLAGLASSVAADVSPISVRVEQVSSDKRTKTDETQKKSLKVFLSNGSAKEQQVKVKYYFFAKSAGAKDISVVDPGDKDVTVKPHGEEMVETGSSTVTMTLNQPAQKGGKPAAATGQKLVGYGVQIVQDDKVVADYFSEPSLKTNLSGGGKSADKAGAN